MIDLDGLQKIAERAGRYEGEWFHSPPYDPEDGGPEMISIGPFPIDGSDGETPRDSHYESTICEVWGGNYDVETNAAHITAFCPQTVLQLIALAKIGQTVQATGPDVAAHLDALMSAGYVVTIAKK